MSLSFKNIAFMLFIVSLPTLAITDPFKKTSTTPLPKITRIKQELIQYHNSGAYTKQIKKTIADAKAYLQFRINQNKKLTHPKKLAIVLDIDETSLSNYPDLARMQFGGSPQQVNAAEMAAHDPAIPATLALYQFAKTNKVSVFFVTGRTTDMRQATIKNLINAGYTTWKRLYLKPLNYHQSSVVAYKSRVRQQIEKQGYDIVLDIGDQYSDLKGGFADMRFKMPDPFYFIK